MRQQKSIIRMWRTIYLLALLCIVPSMAAMAEEPQRDSDEYIDNLLDAVSDRENLFCAQFAAQHLAHSKLNERQSVVLISKILGDRNSADISMPTSACVDAIAAVGPGALPHLLKELPHLRKKWSCYAVVLAAIANIGEIPEDLRSILDDEFTATLPEHQAAVAAVILNCGGASEKHETVITNALKNNSEPILMLSIVLPLMRPAAWFQKLMIPTLVAEVRAGLERRREDPRLWKTSLFGDHGIVITTLQYVGPREKDGVVKLLEEARQLAIKANYLDAYYITITLCRLQPDRIDTLLKELFRADQAIMADLNPIPVTLILQNDLYGFLDTGDKIALAVTEILIDQKNRDESTYQAAALFLYVIGPRNSAEVDRLIKELEESSDAKRRDWVAFAMMSAVRPRHQKKLQALYEKEQNPDVKRSIETAIQFASGALVQAKNPEQR